MPSEIEKGKFVYDLSLIEVDRQIDRQIDRQTNRQIDRQIDRYIDKSRKQLLHRKNLLYDRHVIILIDYLPSRAGPLVLPRDVEGGVHPAVGLQDILFYTTSSLEYRLICIFNSRNPRHPVLYHFEPRTINQSVHTYIQQ